MVILFLHQIYGLKEEDRRSREVYVCLEGCYMYVSPGEHNKLAIPTPIPVGTVLECEYEYKFFTYTSYNGVNGWVVDLDFQTADLEKIAKIAHKSNAHIITTTSASTYSQPDENYKKTKIIPQNTELQVMWSYVTEWQVTWGYVMVTYDNENVWIRYEDVAYEDDEVYDETIEFSEDLIIDGETLISKGETVKLYSKYSIFGPTYLDYADYYFTYKNSGFWTSDLRIFYPSNHYVMFFEDYNGLPINQKIKVKYCRTFLRNFGADENWVASILGRYYFEYNNKIYDIKVYRNVNYIIIDDDSYRVYSVATDLDVTRSPYDNEVIARLSSGDIVYEADFRKGLNLDESVCYVTTEKGVSGFTRLITWSEDGNINATKIAGGVTKDELSNYIRVSKGDTTQFVNAGNSGEYSEYLKYNLSGDYMTNKEITFNINFFSDEPQEKIIPIQSKITMLGTAAIVKNENESNLYYQISYEGQSGYAKFGEGDLTEVIAKPSGELVDASSGEDRINVYDIQNKKKEASDLVICILCICGAAILALTVIVTIKLVNKSSKKNSDSDKENNDTNTNA